MRKFLTLSAAVAVLCAVAVSAPASASDRAADGIHNGKAVAQTFSARWRHHYRYGYYRPRYWGPRYFYGGPYYGYPYGYAYAPRYYRHYRRPGIYFGFGF